MIIHSRYPKLKSKSEKRKSEMSRMPQVLIAFICHSPMTINNNKQSLILVATMSQKTLTVRKTDKLINATNSKRLEVMRKTSRGNSVAALYTNSATIRGQNVRNNLCNRVNKSIQFQSRNSSQKLSYEGQNPQLHLKSSQF